MSYNIPTPSEIAARLESEATLATGTQYASLPGTAENMIVRIVSIAVYELYCFVAYLALQILPPSASDEFLIRHANFWLGEAHKAASSATGTVIVVGTSGTVIPAGTLVTRADGYVYYFDVDVEIGEAGTAEGIVTAQDAGGDTNAVAGIILTLSSAIVGVISITVGSDGLGGGANVESDEYLYGRIEDRVQNPPQGGAERDYETWAKKVSGVTRAWASGKQYGLGTVGVTFVMDERDDIIPTASEVEIVQEYIDQQRPVTADVTVFAPETEAVNFEIALSPNTAAVRTVVQTELEDLFQREAKASGVTLYLSRISEAISIGAGESHHIIISPNESLSFDFGTLPVLGDITWSGV